MSAVLLTGVILFVGLFLRRHNLVRVFLCIEASVLVWFSVVLYYGAGTGSRFLVLGVLWVGVLELLMGLTLLVLWSRGHLFSLVFLCLHLSFLVYYVGKPFLPYFILL